MIRKLATEEKRISATNFSPNAWKNTFFQILNQMFMVMMAVAVLYPLFFVLMTSLKTNEEIIQSPFTFTSVHFSNYVEAWRVGQVGQYFMNSVIVTGITLSIQIVIILLAGYSFGKLRPAGSKILLTVYLSAMLVTSEMTTVPVFMMMRNLGLYNTRWGIILPYIAFGIVLGTYIVTNFIRELPKELDEAARIDGAGIFDIMIKIDLPMIVPVISTIVILNFQAVWSEFYWALIMIKKDSIRTLPLGLINFQSQYSSNYGVLSAGLTILTIPVLIVYLFASSYFIQGISLGAVKG